MGGANASVVEIHPKLCRVLMDDGGAERLCSFRRAQVVKRDREGPRERSPLCVGDRVEVLPQGSKDGVVESVEPRRNQLVRAAPGRDSQIHALAANVDLVMIVTSAHEPDFNPGFVDRFLVGAQAAGIPSAIILNKMDLLHPGKAEPWHLYEDVVRVPVLPCCVATGQGLDAILERCRDATVVFAGHSGVGKTSLLRKLLGSDVGRVGAVNAGTARGQHTTTSARGYRSAIGAGTWIDTPGVRAFGLQFLDTKRLLEYFPDLRELDPKGYGSLPDELLDRLVAGEAAELVQKYPRLESYRRILQSLREGEG
ncbi:MAG TPA: ribosome small subunit-dependent GTPase A [Bdellovibrionota bacterium]|nr:ribosome small subunit-dependent GTPase A [Bdellovibrionota bacterium]